MNIVLAKKTVRGDCAGIFFFLIAYQFLIKYNPCKYINFFSLGYFLEKNVDSAKLIEFLITYLTCQIKKLILPG